MLTKNANMELAKSLSGESLEINAPHSGKVAKGEYFGRVNGGEWAKEGDNIIPIEGLAHLLNVSLGSKAKEAGYYLALFSGSATPAANWTAASFAATANEIVSMTEGYSNPTRPAWTPANATTGSIDNLVTVPPVGVFGVEGSTVYLPREIGRTASTSPFGPICVTRNTAASCTVPPARVKSSPRVYPVPDDTRISWPEVQAAKVVLSRPIVLR